VLRGCAAEISSEHNGASTSLHSAVLDRHRRCNLNTGLVLARNSCACAELAFGDGTTSVHDDCVRVRHSIGIEASACGINASKIVCVCVRERQNTRGLQHEQTGVIMWNRLCDRI
jgi:hypothetical protein